MLDTHNRPENGMCDMRHLVDSFNLCLHARACVCVCVRVRASRTKSMVVWFAPLEQRAGDHCVWVLAIRRS